MEYKSAEDQFRAKLAAWLGITFDELEEYGEDVEANELDEDNDDYAYKIQFSESTTQDILDKMSRIDEDRTVYFNLEELDEIQ
jgi:hypothetical protein